MIHPFRFLIGYTVCRIPKESAGEFVNLCRERGFLYRNFVFGEDFAAFDCPSFVAPRLIAACRANGISLQIEGERGLPGLLKRYRYRVGILVGILLFCTVVALSECVLWDVRIEGNEQIPSSRIEQGLRECGLYRGALRSEMDIDAMENRFLSGSDEISWMSINVRGTVAYVQVREVEQIPAREPTYDACDLVASRGGTVEWFEDVRGNVLVSIGQDVAEGDLLVGGLFGGEGKPSYYTCARGRVMARTEHVFSVEIPIEHEQKTYTGRVFEEKYLIFFEKEIKFFGNTGNLPLSCDTIETVAYAQTSSGEDLPVGIRTVRYYEYELGTSRYGEAEAPDVAHEAMRYRLEEEMSDAELISKKTTGAWQDDKYILTCYVTCIENIAKTVEIPIKKGRP